MSTPEQRARENIDRLLDVAGWKVQNRDEMNLGAGRGDGRSKNARVKRR